MSRNRTPLRANETLDYDTNKDIFYLQREEGRMGRQYKSRGVENLLVNQPDLKFTESSRKVFEEYMSSKLILQ